jgi:hypothetical protein
MNFLNRIQLVGPLITTLLCAQLASALVMLPETIEWREIIGAWLAVSVIPVLALTIALVNLLYDKGNPNRKWLLPFGICTAMGLGGVQVLQNYKERIKVQTQRIEAEKNDARAQKTEALLVETTSVLKNFVGKQKQSPIASPQKQKQSPEQLTNLIVKQNEAANQPAATDAIPNKGWAYYGLEDGDGGWTRRYFKKASGNSVASPQVGDVVIAIGRVNAREGHIEYSGNDWVNKRSIGVIMPNDRLRVVNVYPIEDSFIWIKFERVF